MTRLAVLQWGRRVNTAEWSPTLSAHAVNNQASMGPPREHGGMDRFGSWKAGDPGASMGPPREHGGMPRRLPDTKWPSWRFNGAAA